jgi:hypothetical protein
MKQFQVNSFGELLDAFSSLPQDGDFCYRGQSNTQWSLVPSMFRGLIGRTLDDYELRQLASIERDIYREFGERALRHVNNDDKWLLLCYAQHYGTPTRLLDWSTNRLVGIYFAVCESLETDAAIWALDMSRLAAQFPKVVGRRALGRGLRSEVMPKRHLSLFEAVSRPIVHNPDPLPVNFFAVFQPPDIDQRILNQKGLFTVHVTFGVDDLQSSLVVDHGDYLRQLETQIGQDLLWKFIIPKTRKVAIKLEVRNMGLDPSSLFPDLVGIGQYLTEKRLEFLQTEILGHV